MKSVSPVWVAVAIVVILVAAVITFGTWRARLANPEGNPEIGRASCRERV